MNAYFVVIFGWALLLSGFWVIVVCFLCVRLLGSVSIEFSVCVSWLLCLLGLWRCLLVSVMGLIGMLTCLLRFGCGLGGLGLVLLVGWFA